MLLWSVWSFISLPEMIGTKPRALSLPLLALCFLGFPESQESRRQTGTLASCCRSLMGTRWGGWGGSVSRQKLVLYLVFAVWGNWEIQKSLVGSELTFLVELGLNSGLSTWKTGALLLEPHLHSPCFALVLLEMGGSHELFAQAGLKLRSSQSQPPK
jgi:hypothetical protein